ncbi:restriction endonuclease subunit S [Nocardia vaccinii]|uniref:restriction endonuclease subunit S n=1 Tax=Nocardia vaccinii TaxID=1822 RepID=UPI0009FF7DAD|nr:restriction endonuclease subunit S [Nocardia vaccinii]
MADISMVPLIELCDAKRGITYGIVKVGDYIEGGVPVIRGGDIRNNRIVFNDEKRVTEEVSNQYSRTILVGGEIVINLISEPGYSALVPMEMAGFNVSRDVATVALNGVANHEYVNWYLKSPAAIDWLAARLSGSVTQKINLSSLRELPVCLPTRSEQDAIAEVLGVLDDKIAANDTVTQKSDELANALWLNALDESEQVPLSSLARFVNGKAFTKDASGSGRVVIRIAELNSGIGGSTVYNDIEVHDDHVARPGDLLFAWSGSLTVARWFHPEAIINQHIFKVMPVTGRPLWMVNQAVLSMLAAFKAIAADKATTMGHIQRRHLDELAAIPSPRNVKGIDELMTGLWNRALAAEVENLQLAQTRDELLPLLMSGKLRVKDAEQIVEKIA